jgi:hypothetical protein
MRQNNPRVSIAIQRVLAGDESSYDVIYKDCDPSLRSFIGARYGHLGDDFVSEVAIRTHEYGFTHLDSYSSDSDATFVERRRRSSRRAA